MEEGARALIPAIVVTHGRLGAELIRTAESILGPQEGIGFVSNEGNSLDSLGDAVRDRLRDQDGPLVLFVDLLGGSCSHVCREIRGHYPKSAVFSGVNLPMLLEFFYNRDRVPFEELRERLLEKGKNGIRCL